MFSVVTNWELSQIDFGAWLAHHKMRFDVFGQRMSYDTLNANGMECDFYDNPLADYAVVMNEGGAIACCRLIDCEHPILLRDIWPDLLGDFDSRQPGLIEATRIGAVKDGLDNATKSAAFDLLLSTILAYAALRKRSGIIGIMPERLFKTALERRGCITEYLAPSASIDGRATIAGRVDVWQSLHKRSARSGDHYIANSGKLLLGFPDKHDAICFAAKYDLSLQNGRNVRPGNQSHYTTA